MSLSFVEDGLSYAGPQGLCLLLGPTQGQKKTTAEKESTNMLITRVHAQRYTACTNSVRTLENTPSLTCLFHGVEKMQTRFKIYTCGCPHLEILWDMGGRLFLLSVWWATGHHGPASLHTHGVLGLQEEVGVAGG